MPCLNASTILNALEQRIVDDVPSNVGHVAILGAGDGRLAQAIKEKVDGDIAFSLAEPRDDLRAELSAFEGTTDQVFDTNWIKERVENNGEIDYFVAYNIHEFWQGNLSSLKKMLDQLSESGKAWITFRNSFARAMLQFYLPGDVASFTSLSQPVRLGAHMDYTSWLSFFAVQKMQVLSTWGLMEASTFEYCQKKSKGEEIEGPIELEIGGLKYPINTIQDAYLRGASIVGLEVKKGIEEDYQPSFSAAPFSSPLYQSLIVPYGSAPIDEHEDFVAQIEVEKWLSEPDETLNELGKTVIKEAEEMNPKASKVLLLGAGWGKEVFQIKKLKPEWSITGVEESELKASLSKTAFPEDSITVTAHNPTDALPFEDGSFDLVLATGYFSKLHQHLARTAANDALRVSSSGVIALEDTRGPDVTLKQKLISVTHLFDEEKAETTLQSIAANGQQTGIALVKAVKK